MTLGPVRERFASDLVQRSVVRAGEPEAFLKAGLDEFQRIRESVRASAATMAIAAVFAWFGVIHSPLPSAPLVLPSEAIARLKLESMGHKLDKLTPEQEHYLASWQEGT